MRLFGEGEKEKRKEKNLWVFREVGELKREKKNSIS